MKKIYLFFTIVSISLTTFKANAQEAVNGGNMEDETLWTVTQLVTDEGKTATVVFNYKDSKPTAGSGGAMHITATNFAAGTGNNMMVWQEVSLKANHRYVVNAAFRDLGGLPKDAYWCQWYVDLAVPAEGSDFLTEGDACAQINTWNNCLADYSNIDITLQTWECENGAKSDTVVVDADGTYTFGVKMGLWNNNVVSYDIVIDNMSLFDLEGGSSISTINNNAIQIYPNPVVNELKINSNYQFVRARILNVLGQNVLKVSNLQNTINVSELKSGIYFVELKDSRNNITINKFYKR